jgi:hypothetical protein
MVIRGASEPSLSRAMFVRVPRYVNEQWIYFSRSTGVCRLPVTLRW